MGIWGTRKTQQSYLSDKQNSKIDRDFSSNETKDKLKRFYIIKNVEKKRLRGEGFDLKSFYLFYSIFSIALKSICCFVCDEKTGKSIKGGAEFRGKILFFFFFQVEDFF